MKPTRSFPHTGRHLNRSLAAVVPATAVAAATTAALAAAATADAMVGQITNGASDRCFCFTGFRMVEYPGQQDWRFGSMLLLHGFHAWSSIPGSITGALGLCFCFTGFRLVEYPRQHNWRSNNADLLFSNCCSSTGLFGNAVAFQNKNNKHRMHIFLQSMFAVM